MTVVALTGGIASGKSTVAEMFRELGAVCIDADDVSRDVVEPGTPGLRDIVATFGEDVLREGHLNREALGRIVFGDASAREQLNRIVHPLVRARSEELFEAARTANPNVIIIYAIPLLVEAGSERSFDAIITVSAEEETRVKRLVSARGMTEAEARARVSAQANEAQRLAIADHVIDTNGSLEQTQSQVDEIWRELSTA
ncbi:MAG: dephospho-CoA kinase [Actinobacteria bacterium]|nr:dephospho-CoA kinase [Actinomycetota bacterium]